MFTIDDLDCIELVALPKVSRPLWARLATPATPATPAIVRKAITHATLLPFSFSISAFALSTPFSCSWSSRSNSCFVSPSLSLASERRILFQLEKYRRTKSTLQLALYFSHLILVLLQLRHKLSVDFFSSRRFCKWFLLID